MLKIKEINQDDIDLVIGLLETMQNELQEFDFNSALVKDVILRDISNGVKWFLFQENDTVIGTCHMQYLHNYWRIEKRYYLGGFYLRPEYRAKGTQKIKFSNELKGY